jgi:signal transduction histidine kinase
LLNVVRKTGFLKALKCYEKGIPRKIESVVEDNGQGFDIKHAAYVKNPKRAFGFTSMKERIELSGGAFAIESTPGAGTVVRPSWPI